MPAPAAPSNPARRCKTLENGMPTAARVRFTQRRLIFTPEEHYRTPFVFDNGVSSRHTPAATYRRHGAMSPAMRQTKMSRRMPIEIPRQQSTKRYDTKRHHDCRQFNFA